MIVPLKQLNAIIAYMQGPNVCDVPHGCSSCMFSEPEWQDGGHCYHFREVPESGRCHLHEFRLNMEEASDDRLSRVKERGATELAADTGVANRVLDSVVAHTD